MLFVGGPDDGVIGPIIAKSDIRWVESDPILVASWGEPLARMIPNYRYGTYRYDQIIVSGRWYAVMADVTLSRVDVQSAVTQMFYYFGFPQKIVTSHPVVSYNGPTFQQLMQWADDYLDPEPQKTKEEKLAWLEPSGKKEFL